MGPKGSIYCRHRLQRKQDHRMQNHSGNGGGILYHAIAGVMCMPCMPWWCFLGGIGNDIYIKPFGPTDSLNAAFPCLQWSLWCHVLIAVWCYNRFFFWLSNIDLFWTKMYECHPKEALYCDCVRNMLMAHFLLMDYISLFDSILTVLGWPSFLGLHRINHCLDHI